MNELLTGTVTFLFMDLEGSPHLWEQHPEAMNAALARHDERAQARLGEPAYEAASRRGAESTYDDPVREVVDELYRLVAGLDGA